jgi:hypothetical protein
MMRLGRPTIKQVQLWNWFCFALVGLIALLAYSVEVYVAAKQGGVAQMTATLSDSIAAESNLERLRSFAVSCVEASDHQPKEGIDVWIPSSHTGLLFVAAFFFMLSALFTAEASGSTLQKPDGP